METLQAAVNSEQFQVVMTSLGLSQYLPAYQGFNGGLESMMIAMQSKANEESQWIQ